MGLGALLGWGALTVSRYEQTAKRDIAARLQGDEKVVSLRMVYPGLLSPGLGEVREATIAASHFRVDGLPFTLAQGRSQRGTIQRLKVDLRDFELTGLPVDRLSGWIPSCRFDLAYATKHGKIRISKAGIGRAEVVLDPEGIATWLMRRSPGLHEVKGAVIEEGEGPKRIYFTGRIRFAGFDVPFDVRSRLKGEAAKLLLDRPEVRIDGKLADAIRIRGLIDALNPVVDGDRDLHLMGAVGIDSVTIEHGKIVARGPVTIPIDPANTTGEIPAP